MAHVLDVYTCEKRLMPFGNHYFSDMSPSKIDLEPPQLHTELQTSQGISCWNATPTSHSFFEGVEKLLEVWFTKGNGDIEDCDLRRIPR